MQDAFAGDAASHIGLDDDAGQAQGLLQVLQLLHHHVRGAIGQPVAQQVVITHAGETFGALPALLGGRRASGPGCPGKLSG